MGEFLFQASEFYPYRNEYFYVMIEKYVIIAEKVVCDKKSWGLHERGDEFEKDLVSDSRFWEE